MAGGLAALLDDIATLAKMAAANIDDVAAAAGRASAKAAGVVVDDTAVTPQYLEGIKPERELPIIKRITIGSLRNKLLIILPIALLLSQFAPWALTPILMLGGSYLCFEGMEKVWEKISGHGEEHSKPAIARGPDAEDQMVKSAALTDLILSAEIMVIALNEVANEKFVARTIILIAVALLITFLVYGVVALIVKMDDIGIALTKRESPRSQKFGHALVAGMPKLLTAIGIIGTFAMIWVGGHIILVGLNELGLTAPHAFVHHMEGYVSHIAGVGGFLAGVVNTIFSLILGAIWGAILVGIMHFMPFGRKEIPDESGHGELDQPHEGGGAEYDGEE
ncbi:ABC transporter [Bowdeniella nasicola]|uniref:ABC transporter n=1 Tax=Bowdeniella nasicola TaxID=208480 RepID=A0A1Q5Q3Q4_9ACTO|nr:DUF808 domain-containing protein [Bowdeniella nasicola]OKL54415.1 ABC transporter [Bowdeniella nasicola]